MNQIMMVASACSAVRCSPSFRRSATLLLRARCFYYSSGSSLIALPISTAVNNVDRLGKQVNTHGMNDEEEKDRQDHLGDGAGQIGLVAHGHVNQGDNSQAKHTGGGALRGRMCSVVEIGQVPQFQRGDDHKKIGLTRGWRRSADQRLFPSPFAWCRCGGARPDGRCPLCR